MAEEKPIIIIKKKGGHGGHHGGAWKVAYADFVTAMMAFFMVMWLINSAEVQTKQAIAQYFRKPGIFETGSGTPLLTGGSGILNDAYSPNLASQIRRFSSGLEQIPMTKRSGDEDAIKAGQKKSQAETGKGVLEKGKENTKGFGLKEINEQGKGAGTNPYVLQQNDQQKADLEAKIKEQIKAFPELSKLLGVVDVKQDADGLNIEIMDTDAISMFAVGSSTINPLAKQAFEKIAEVLKKVPNKFEIIGHTDSRPFSKSVKGFTNWELSSERALAARRLLEDSGIGPEQISSVLGRADRDLKVPTDPMASSNRRITLKVKFPIQEKISTPQQLDETLSKPLPETTITAPETTTAKTSAELTALQPDSSSSSASVITHELAPDVVIEDQEGIENRSHKRTAVNGPKHEVLPESEQSNSSAIFSDFPVVSEPLPFSNN